MTLHSIMLSLTIDSMSVFIMTEAHGFSTILVVLILVITITSANHSAVKTKSLISSDYGSLLSDLLSHRLSPNPSDCLIFVIVFNNLLDNVASLLHVPHSHVVECSFHVCALLLCFEQFLLLSVFFLVLKVFVVLKFLCHVLQPLHLFFLLEFLLVLLAFLLQLCAFLLESLHLPLHLQFLRKHLLLLLEVILRHLLPALQFQLPLAHLPVGLVHLLRNLAVLLHAFLQPQFLLPPLLLFNAAFTLLLAELSVHETLHTLLVLDFFQFLHCLKYLFLLDLLLLNNFLLLLSPLLQLLLELHILVLHLSLLPLQLLNLLVEQLLRLQPL